MNTYDLYINPKAASPKTGLVRSIENTTPVKMRDLVLGDQIKFRIYLGDGEGGIHEKSGSQYLVPTIAVGTPGLVPTNGTWQLALQADGLKTSETIPANCTAAQIKDAIDEAVGWSGLDLDVTGEPGRWQIEFIGTRALTAQPGLHIHASTLSPLSWIVVDVVQEGSGTVGNHIILVSYGQYAMAAAEAVDVSSDHWLATLDLNSPSLLAAISSSAQAELTFEVEIDGAYGYDGNNSTAVQTPVHVFNDLIKHHGLIWYVPRTL